MVNTVYFMICLALVCFLFMFIGWMVGYADAKKKYKE